MQILLPIILCAIITVVLEQFSTVSECASFLSDLYLSICLTIILAETF